MKKSFLIILITFICANSEIALSSGCEVEDVDVWFNNPSCSGSSQTWKDFNWGPFGWFVCAIGPSSEYGYSGYESIICDTPFGCQCLHFNDVVWKYMEKNSWPSGGSEGQTCKVRWDGFANPCGETWEGKWDPDDYACVKCDSNNREISRHLCTDGNTASGDNNCEAACSSTVYSKCDEKNTYDQITSCSCGETYYNDMCSSSCNCEDSHNKICRSSAYASGCTAPSDLNGHDSIYSKVDSLNISGSKVSGNCVSAKVVKDSSFSLSYRISGTYMNYESHSIYMRKLPSGTFSQQTCDTPNVATCSWSNVTKTLTAPSELGSYQYEVRSYGYGSPMCGYDDGYKQTCNVQVVECLTSSDCPACPNHVKPVCNTNYVCECQSCSLDSQCESSYPTCYCGYCDSSFTSAGCSSGYCCNRGYGGSGVGSCVVQGSIYNNIYLCASATSISTCSSGICTSRELCRGNGGYCVSEPCPASTPCCCVGMIT